MGIQVEADSKKEAAKIGGDRLIDTIEELNEDRLGMEGIWLIDSNDGLIVTQDE